MSGGTTGRAREDLAPLVLGLAVACAVCAPLFSGRRVLLLDWSIGPHPHIVPAAAYGLTGGLAVGTPYSIVVDLLVNVLGPAGTWIPLVVFFPTAAVAIGRLVGGGVFSRLAAAALYCVNPWVFDRIYVGHVGLLVGYALLPLATASVLRARRQFGARRFAPALWWAVLTACSPHFAWIYGVVVAAVLVTQLARERPALPNLGWLVGSVAGFALTSLYFLLPRVLTTMPVDVGAGSLPTYRTTGDVHLGLFVNVAGLYGFWRRLVGPRLPKDDVTGWPLLLLALLIVAAVGVRAALRRDDGAESAHRAGGERRSTALVLLLCAVAGFLLASGDQGPTGAVYRWAYFHVPFFAVMREPEKFSMLLALAYAVFVGWGVGELTKSGRTRHRRLSLAGASLLAVGLPLAYTPTIFDGLAGQITASALPASWGAADRVMGTGEGQVLFLPWHLYMAFPFTGYRVVADPAPTSFRRIVISGDNVEVGATQTYSTSPRSSYLQQLFSIGTATSRFGRLVAPLGIRYVALAKTVDWRSYHWLGQQLDLRKVLDTPSLEIWENTDYVGVGARSSELVSVPDVVTLVRLADSGRLPSNAAVELRRSARVSLVSSASVTTVQRVHEISPIALAVPSGPGRWIAADPGYQKGWVLNEDSAQQSAEGTLVVRGDRRGGTLGFGPWGLVKLGSIISAAAFVTLAIGSSFHAPRRRHRRPRVADKQV